MPVLSNSKHEEFAQCVGTGEPASHAYRRIFGCSNKSAKASAARLRQIPEVSERIAEVETSWRAHREDAADDALLKRFMTLDEKREYLAKVIRTPIGEIDDKSPLCQKYKSTQTGEDSFVTEVHKPDILRAIELDAKLSGELKGDSHQVNVSVSVVLSEAKRVTLVERLAAARKRHAGG